MEIPRRFRARTADQGMDILSTFFVPRIHMLIDFEGPLDRDRLAAALRLCLEAEPVLGCRFVPRWIRPYWERLAPDELDPARLVQTGPDVDAFLAGDFDERQGPQLRALLAPGDRLVLKVNHQAADAGGVKELGYLLAGMYRRLKDDPGYKPTPNLGSRSLRQVYRRFIPRRLFGLLGRVFRELWGNLRPYRSLSSPSGAEKTGAPVYIFKHFSKQRLDALRSRVAEYDATLNDLMVTAMLRALAEQTGWNQESALRLAGTVDLRRYLPGQSGQAICNLSSFYFVNLGRDLGARFTDTLVRVKQHIDRLKTDYFGLSFVFGGYLSSLPYPFALAKILLRKFFRRLQRTGNMPPAMTNMGIIDDEKLDFGSPRVAAAMLATPANQPPTLASGLTGFRDSLSFSVGFYESAIPRTRIKALFDLLDRNLPS
jgi:NRPS condensation-like uncharacterized protein